ncbi:MAG: hypothetical protein HOE54_09220, partial [Gammaproteobacteria bacterium]|nr:hypothetical protein [Gammaproteobacteria bacterium]
QWLMFFLGPLTSLYILLMILASLQYWGIYILSRRVFHLSAWAASAAGVAFMFNTFVVHRMIIGHVGFHGFALVPWITLLLVARWEIPVYPLNKGGNIVLAALLITYWFQSGMGSVVIPAALSVAAIACIAGLRNLIDLPQLLTRGFAASVLALGISASKIFAGLTFMSSFPRDGYKLPGFESTIASIEMALRAISTPSQSVYHRGTELIQNQQWSLAPHEWSYSLTPVPLLIVALAGLLLLPATAGFFKRGLTPLKASFLAGLSLILSLPILLNIYTPEWNSTLKQIPLIKNNSSLIRWYIIYIPVLAIALGLAIDSVPHWKKWTPIVAGFCMVAIITMAATENRKYYFTEGSTHLAIPAIQAWSSLGQTKPSIKEVRVVDRITSLAGNDIIYAGYSQLLCYNPGFGYSREHFPVKTLRRGLPLMEQEGVFNLKNPACYVFPDENNCAVGDHFRLDQRDRLTKFINYRPFEFAISSTQLLANRTTLFSLFLAGLSLILMAFTQFTLIVSTLKTRFFV